MLLWILLIVLVFWLIGGTLFHVAQVLFWIIVIVLVVSAIVSALGNPNKNG